MIEFDTLRYKENKTPREHVRYQELLERVIKGADDLSEFPTDLTEGEKESQKMLCSSIAVRFFKDLAMYGPVISDAVIKIIISTLRALGKL